MGKKVVKVIYIPNHSMRKLEQWEVTIPEGEADMEVLHQRMQDHIFSMGSLGKKLGLKNPRELMMEGVSLVPLHKSKSKGKSYGVNLYACELKLGPTEKRGISQSRTQQFPNVRANELIWDSIGRNHCEALGDCFVVKFTDPRGSPPVLQQHVLQPPSILDLEIDEASPFADWVEEAREYWDSKEVSTLYRLFMCMASKEIPSNLVYSALPHIGSGGMIKSVPGTDSAAPQQVALQQQDLPAKSKVPIFVPVESANSNLSKQSSQKIPAAIELSDMQATPVQ